MTHTLFPFAVLLAATAAAQTSSSGPFTAESFEAHRYVPGTLPSTTYWSGQDGWILFDSIALGNPNLAAATVQTAVVRSGSQAVKWDAALMSPGCFGELRRNALFNLTTGVIECEMDFLIASSSNPSTGWEFYTQPAPMPQSCQMRWFIAADGHVEYFDGPAFNLIVTSFFVTKDVWHHARTVVDVFQNTTQIHIDGVLVGTGQPISPYGSLPAHGFRQINVHGAGNDAIYLDNFTMRERIAPHGLSVDLQRLPVNVRSVMDFHLAGGALLANRPYALLGSISGTTPGTPIGTTVLPLVVDAFTGIVMSGFATLPGFLGTFNGSGAATAQFDTQIPVPPFLLGLNIHFAYLTVDTFDAASEPVLVRVTNL